MARKKKVVEINEETVMTMPFPTRTLLAQYVLKCAEERHKRSWNGEDKLPTNMTILLKELTNGSSIVV